MGEQTSSARTVTFVLTDIQRSTALWEAHGEDMGRAVERHEAIIVSATEESGGVVVRSRGEGDSCFCVFESASDAVRAALTAQRALALHEWSGPQVLVRIAIHTGTAELRDGQYYGTVVNRCARLRGIAHGGQTLVSSASADLIGDDVPDGATLKDLGSHRLPDLAQPERVYQLCHSDLPDVFPALASLDSLPNNLPVQLTRFIGREREIAELESLMQTHRLVTLTGPGGSGKTRLATQAAGALMASFPDGVWLVSLGAVTDPDLVVSEIASTLGLREEPGRALLDTVADYLDRRAALFVIDNCEHVLDAAAVVAAELVVRCPYLKLIATSRQALGVEGEVARPLAPLSAPAISSSPTADEISSFEAVQLLADRASLARDGFEVTDANAAAVAQICRQLDGIPLAIEFAAARLGALGPAELARRLDDRFRLLSSTRRSGPERHQTLDAAVDWSYELLGDGERLLFRRLAVLNGRFSLEGAEAVCADDVLPTTEIAELLSHLVEGSLVSADTRGDETSYRMLATIRAFALARLEESGEEDATRANHLRYLVHLAERIEPELVGADQARLLDVLASVHDDARAALAWGVHAEPREALRLAVAMTPFWYTRGHWTEGRRRLEETMAAAPEPSVELATALRGAGNLAGEQGETEQARVLFERALDLYGRFEDEEGKVLVLTSLGNLAASTGDREKAKKLFDESLALVRRGGHQRRIVGMLINLATSAQARGDESAEGLYHEALSLSREHGHTRGVAGALVGLGTIAQGAGDVERARAMYQEALALFTELGDKMGTAAALSSLGNTARARGDLDEAFDLLTRALPLHRELGDRRASALALARLGTVAWARADLAAAADLHAQALGAFRELGDVAGVVASLASLARVARTTDDERSALAWLDQALDACRRAPEIRATATCLEELAGLTVREDPERAARLFGAAEAIRGSTGASGVRTGQATYERDVAVLKERLPAPQVERLWSAGRSMPAAEAVAYASKVAVPS